MTELVHTVIERYVSGTYMDMSSSVVGDIQIDYLISTPAEDTKIASVGRMEMVVDNRTGNFSPNASFQRGTKIRVSTVYDGVSKVRFIGTIRTLDPDTLEWGNQFVRVSCVDWMQYAVDYPSIVLSLQQNYGVDDAVAYLLSLMSVPPESVTYYASRETFDFVFDNARKATQIYSEMSRLALSEFAPIYLRGGNVLVVESADTRKGTNVLTTVPKAPSQLHALLADPNGYSILLIDGTSFAILADEIVTPNLATGTIQPIDIELENGGALINRVTTKTYPTRTDAAPVLLFQLDHTININAFSTFVLRGNWADPNGGAPISGKNIQSLTTGTNYVFTDKNNTVDQSTQLVITANNGSQTFEHSIYNNGAMGVLRTYKVYGYGIYPYNAVETPVMSTGSVSSFSISEMSIDQRYQNDVNAGLRIAEEIVDDEKNPRNRLMSVTFDPSQSSDLMQASQYMDSGDLTWIKNVKPAIDTYAYIRGKKTVINPAGYITETWYLDETDSLQDGLRMIALKFVGQSGGHQGINFGQSTAFNNLLQKTACGWVYNTAATNTFPLFGKYDSISGWYLFQIGSGTIQFRQNYSSANGAWDSSGVQMTGSAGHWHHIAVTYDSSDPSNDPYLYLDGNSLPVRETNTPAGTVVSDTGANLILGNINYPSFEYFYFTNAYLKDMRIYNRILSQADIQQIAAQPTNYLSVPDGLVFQAPCVKSEDYGGITGTNLYPTNMLIDNVYGLRGTPNWTVASGTFWAVKAYDPNF